MAPRPSEGWSLLQSFQAIAPPRPRHEKMMPSISILRSIMLPAEGGGGCMEGRGRGGPPAPGAAGAPGFLTPRLLVGFAASVIGDRSFYFLGSGLACSTP